MLFTFISGLFVAAIIVIFVVRGIERKKKNKLNASDKEYEKEKGIID